MQVLPAEKTSGKHLDCVGGFCFLFWMVVVDAESLSKTASCFISLSGGQGQDVHKAGNGLYL